MNGVGDDVELDDCDEFNSEEMRIECRQMTDSMMHHEIMDAAEGFENTMQKLRDIAKVPSCSAQIRPIGN